MMVSGAGVGLVIPTLTGAGASSLPPERFATGAAVLTMGRQIGAALGVSVLVAVLGTSATSAADFHSAWAISLLGGLTTAVALAALGPQARRVVPVPASPPVPAAPVLAESTALAEGAVLAESTG
jgi:hypothetical protein